MRKIFIMGLFGLSAIISCRNKGDYGSTKDGELTLMAISGQKKGLLKVRLNFDQKGEGLDVPSFVEAMQYDMDSCFYIQGEGTKSYPIYVEPIANGMRKTFEYLIGFDRDFKKGEKLVYVDRHRSKKNIELTLP